MRITSSLHQVFLAALVLLFGAGATMAQVPQLLNYQGRIAVNGTNFTGTGQFMFALVDGGTNLTRTATGTATVVYGFLVEVTVTDGGAGYTTLPTVSVIGGGGSGANFTAQISGGVVTNVIVNSADSDYTGLPAISFSAPTANIVAQTFWSNDGTSSSGGQPTASVPLPVTKGLYSVLLGDTTLSNMTALPASVFANPGVWLRVWFSDGTTGFQQLTPDQRLAAVGYAIMAGTVPDGSITTAKIAAGAVGAAQIAPGAVGSSQLSSNLSIPGTLAVNNLVINGSAVTGSTNYIIPSGTNIQTYAGGTYFITNTSANIILPTIANVGDTIRLITLTANGQSQSYNILQNPGQRIVAWNTLYPGSPVVSSADGSRLLVNAGQGFYLSTNFTASWTLQPPLEPWPTPNSCWPLQISSDGSHIFAGVNFNYFSGVVVSGDYGQSWFLNTNFSPNAIACSTNGVKAVAVAGVGIFTSTDAGSNWTIQTGAPTNANWGSVASSSDGTKLVAIMGWNGSASGIYTSGNSGSNWTLQTNAPTNAIWTSVASSSDGSKLVAVAQFNGSTETSGIYTSRNSGSNWILQTSAPTNAYWESVASSADGTKLVAVADVGIYTSVNSGSTWMLQTNGLPSPSYWGYSVASSADGLKLAASVYGQLYTSVDLGNTWTPCSTLPANALALIAVSSLGTSGGATFNYLNNNELTLVYLGNGMFAIADQNQLSGY